jgi:hypothetical protein
VRAGLGDDHRLCREVGHRVDDVPWLDMLSRRDRLGSRHVKASGEHAEALEYGLMTRLEHGVRPVDGRAERLVPFDRGAAAAGEQPEPLVEPGGDLGRSERDDPGGGQLDGERDAVQPATDLGDGDVVGVDGRRRGHRLGAFAEHLSCLVVGK